MTAMAEVNGIYYIQDNKFYNKAPSFPRQHHLRKPGYSTLTHTKQKMALFIGYSPFTYSETR